MKHIYKVIIGLIAVILFTIGYHYTIGPNDIILLIANFSIGILVAIGVALFVKAIVNTIREILNDMDK